MFLSYNGFNHPPGQCNVRWHFDAIENEGQQIVAYKARADISGKLISRTGDSSDLTEQILLLQLAYRNGGDLILIQNDGSPSANSIINDVTLGGTRVVQAPSFPDGGAAQYVTQRDFTCAIEAEIPNLFESFDLWSFEEIVTFQGDGGPATDVIECVQGDPIVQTTKQRTAITATQEGRAVGYLAYRAPPYPGPLWPQLEQRHLRMQRIGSPKRTGSGSNTRYKMFPTTWRYTFKSADSIESFPNFWTP